MLTLKIRLASYSDQIESLVFCADSPNTAAWLATGKLRVESAAGSDGARALFSIDDKVVDEGVEFGFHLWAFPVRVARVRRLESCC